VVKNGGYGRLSTLHWCWPTAEIYLASLGPYFCSNSMKSDCALSISFYNAYSKDRPSWIIVRNYRAMITIQGSLADASGKSKRATAVRI